ncbi:Ig-like domain repeat protein [Glycomyces harbinensis]|uniref:Alpha-tubulin suppressor n=1 Tax=Glycomyces harbinensis TaxID=58114 RepID=A0A1G7BCI0_9ACTN|nr:Ig-like domain repeat protein [Glycomyces harbinensis]SDE24759.1 Alpha-tubulin suppressor [Glycomyces harbinensis]
MASAATAATGDEALSWGRNQYGQLGNGSLNSAGEWVPGSVALPDGASVTAVGGGYGFSIALTSAGAVLAWGQNDVGQLGEDSFTNSTEPVNVELPEGTTVTAISVGDDHVLALTSTGQVLAWGYNEWGQLGNGTNTESGLPVEVDLPSGTTVTAIAAGAGHSLALTSTGEVLSWGDNDLGQLGDGTTTQRTTPVEVRLPAGITVTALAGGDDHSHALTSTGEVLSWGYNVRGQLGDGTTTTRTEPVAANLPSGTTVTGIAAGTGFQSYALTSTGELLAWGDNTYGQIGDGTNTHRSEPVSVHLPEGTIITQVASGDDHAVALTDTGQVWSWGYNRYGQVGDGTTTNRNEPVEVRQPEAQPAVAIGVGSYHSLAIAQSPQTTTTLSAEPERAQVGETVTLTADVSCTVGTPTGTVTFTAGGEEIGSAALEDGTATLVTDALPEGEHTIVARYEGDDSCPASESGPVTVTVGAGQPECDFPPYEDGGDGDGDGAPADDGADGSPGPCRPLADTGNDTSAIATVGLGATLLGGLVLLAATRVLRKRAQQRQP